MKRYIILLLVIAINFVSFSNEIELLFKPQKGQKINYTLESRASIKAVTISQTHSKVSLLVKDINNDLITLGVTFSLFKIGPKSPGPGFHKKGNWYYSNGSEKNVLSSILKEITKLSFSITVDKKWKILKITMPDKYQEKIIYGVIKYLEVAEEDVSALRVNVLSLLNEYFNEIYFVSFFGKFEEFFINKKLKIGSSVHVDKIGINKNIKLNQNYTLSEFNDSSVCITTETLSSKQTEKMDKFKLKSENYHGNSTIDIKFGWINRLYLEHFSNYNITDKNGNTRNVFNGFITTIEKDLID